MYKKQTAAINGLTERYTEAIFGHMDSLIRFWKTKPRRLLSVTTNLRQLLKRSSILKTFIKGSLNCRISQKSLSALKKQTDSIVVSSLNAKTDNTDPVKATMMTKQLKEIQELLQKIEAKKTV